MPKRAPVAARQAQSFVRPVDDRRGWAVQPIRRKSFRDFFPGFFGGPGVMMCLGLVDMRFCLVHGLMGLGLDDSLGSVTEFFALLDGPPCRFP